MPRSIHAAAPRTHSRAHARAARRRYAARRRALGRAIRDPASFPLRFDRPDPYGFPDNELARNVFTRCSCYLCRDDEARHAADRRLARQLAADVADGLAERGPHASG